MRLAPFVSDFLHAWVGWIVLLVVAVVLPSCGTTNNWLELNAEPDIEAAPFRITGAVRYLDVEGGLFAIESSDGTTYNPVNLPDSYQVDRMTIEADVRLRTDLVSPAMVGPVVELLRIRRVDEAAGAPAR